MPVRCSVPGLNKGIGMALLAILLLQSAPLPDEHSFTVIGLGNQTCAQWIADKAGDRDARSRDIEWFGGFLSAANIVRVSFGRGNATKPGDDFADLVGRIDEYCTERPEDRVVEAGIALLGVLNRN